MFVAAPSEAKWSLPAIFTPSAILRRSRLTFFTGMAKNNPGNPSGEPETLGRNGYSKLAAILKKEIDCDWALLALHGNKRHSPMIANCSSWPGRARANFLPEEGAQNRGLLKTADGCWLLLSKPCGLESRAQAVGRHSGG